MRFSKSTSTCGSGLLHITSAQFIWGKDVKFYSDLHQHVVSEINNIEVY